MAVRLFSAATVQKFTAPQSPRRSADSARPGLGHRLPYSSNRGELFPIGSYGHTGFTGTSMWIDPFSHSYVIILTNACILIAVIRSLRCAAAWRPSWPLRSGSRLPA